MNDRNQETMGPWLERLVDGELSPDEYRSLVAALDDEPGAWRQCALSFLEAQALGQDLGTIRRSLDLRGVDATPQKPKPHASHLWDKAQALLAIAASFLVAFGLGLAAPKIVSWAQERLASGNISAGGVVATTDYSPNDVRHEVLRHVGDVRLLVDGAAEGTQEAGHVPVYEVGQDVTQFLASEKPALGPEMMELLRQHGYDVRREQQYFPAPLDDGRQIIVPVEGYQLTPVSRRY